MHVFFIEAGQGVYEKSNNIRLFFRQASLYLVDLFVLLFILSDTHFEDMKGLKQRLELFMTVSLKIFLRITYSNAELLISIFI